MYGITATINYKDWTEEDTIFDCKSIATLHTALNVWLENEEVSSVLVTVTKKGEGHAHDPHHK